MRRRDVWVLTTTKLAMFDVGTPIALATFTWRVLESAEDGGALAATVKLTATEAVVTVVGPGLGSGKYFCDGMSDGAGT